MTAHATTLTGLEGVLKPEHEGVAALVAEGLIRVEDRIDKRLRSELAPVRALAEHVERYRGKMLRPMMTLLCGLAAAEARRGSAASLRAEDLTDEHIAVGAVVEMIHIATLVHDDVLDEAETRRRHPTVNRLRGNETAVILGDYLISAAFHLCSSLQDQSVALLIGAVTTRLCEGELLQLHHRDDYSLDEATYYEIVERKTAELIGASCELGAALAGASLEQRALFREFGARLGVAFQIQDDLLDLTGDEATVGKSVGKDLEKGKLTLPLIHHLATADPALRGRTLRTLESGRGESDAQAWARRAALVREALGETGSIAHAREEARRLAAGAVKIVARIAGEGGPGPAASLLDAAAEAVVNRSH